MEDNPVITVLLTAEILETMVPVPKVNPVGPYCTSHSVAVAQPNTHDNVAELCVVLVTLNAPGDGHTGGAAMVII